MSKLIQIKDRQGEAYVFYCPGCEMNHIVPVKYEQLHASTKGKEKPVWAFNGNLDKPSFRPNFKIEWFGAEPPQRCHSIIRDGEIIFLVDSTHKLSGARVKMKDEL
jgi:hypothetical protein